MAHTRIIGDIHGKLYDYELLLTNQERSVQIGDFGIGFAGPYWHEKVNDIHRDTQHRFIRGNHDNPGMCPEMVGWIPDMTVEGDVMFIGGAWSIDWARALMASTGGLRRRNSVHANCIVQSKSMRKPNPAS